MGEVVMSCEDVVMVEERESEEKMANKESSSSMVRWERFLPRVQLRVLLVEADDSTRQIIGALLRKCSYKVASVPDGLKAWEVMKARPNDIDIILTEVELPLISGYALLTLTMEHEICKNIPVIMMSPHDSVSTVYKCMLRGAADFLVKPIRINELKNLWQHVWRRQSMSRGGLGQQGESGEQEKLEATAENNATSDHSSSFKTCAPTQDECIKKGSDAQSSCGKPGLEDESAYMDEVEDISPPKHDKSPVSDLNVQEHTLDLDARMEQNCEQNVNFCTESSDNRDVPTNSSREAIDLIGAFSSQPRCNSFVNDGANKFESFSQLDLSLRRFHSGVFENKTTCEKQMLIQSNASAFTRYVNKTIHTSNSNAQSASTHKEDKMNSGASDNAHGSNTNTTKELPLSYERKVVSPSMTLSKEVENEYQTSSQRLFPIPLPVRGIRGDICSSSAGYGSRFPPTVRTPSPSPSPSSADQHMNSFYQFSVDLVNRGHHYQPIDQSTRISSNQPINKQDLESEPLEDRAQFSLATDQSASSTLCNGTVGHLSGYGFGYGTIVGSSLNVQQDAVVPGGPDSGSEQGGQTTHELSRQRSLLREAALNKFRLKRKERCFEKKVRYESRKKLAEQRPRVKGQFVRQVPPDPPPHEYDNSGGNSVPY